MPLTVDDLKTLVEWLGSDGALAGLDKSDLTIAELRFLLEEQGKTLPAKATRKELVTEVLQSAANCIKKPLDELLTLTSDEILTYFDSVRPSQNELLALLRQLGFRPGSDAKKSLYKYAARQLSETGMFQRVAQTNQDRAESADNAAESHPNTAHGETPKR
ncbi:hypothetical protein WJ41_12885 [Burkholderia ubonensis]|uniref:hypothetical protein n=1 Tax=Burkholderia ubonensis TaxID=101571 RepID=UPI000754C3D0|nr:hypothetical protein [Burkholderia ubonensis]KVH72541.1 hypothetical protein WJ41_12885 [Burkholderia ubonensis]KVU02509.1 hypothetical protein WK61_36345 [Burkholderia ubonensis]